MRKQVLAFFAFVFFTVSFTNVISIEAQVRPYNATDNQVQYLLNRIETRTNTFKREVNRALDRSSLNNTDTEDMITNYISDFESATDALKQKFAGRDSVDADVEDVLSRAAFINQFMQTNRLTTAAQSNWNYIRTDLNTLARYYAVRWNWSNPISTSTTTTTTTTIRPYRVTDTTVQALLSRIETRTDAYKRTMNRALDRSAINNTNTEDNVFEFITQFENETDRLKQKFDARQSVGADVSQLLNRAAYIENFMRNNRLTAAAQRDWTSIRSDLSTLAGYYDVSWNWNTLPTNTTVIGNTNTGVVPYRVSDTNVRTLITRLETNSGNYRRQINADLDRSILNNSRSEDSLNSYITEFENSIDSLKQKFEARRSVGADVENVLTRAYAIDSFMRDYRFSVATETQWRAVRADLDTLSNYYNVSWNWNRQYQPPSKFDEMLTGTYRLNVSQSDNVSDVVDRATSAYYQVSQRDRVKTNLERRLSPPEMLAIEKNGNQVIVASSASRQVTFNADGTSRTETNANGRTTKVTASTYYDGVALSYEGERANDFYVNFIPMSNGQLKVIRRVYLENRNDTVTVASVYDKVNNTAQWSISDGYQNNNAGTVNNTFAIPNNTKLIAVLTSPVSTRTSQNGDRFTMRVTSPSEYNDAIIEGRVAKTERSGRVSGRAAVSLEFDTIRFRNQTYRFAGIVDQVRLANGENVTVNNEGTVRDNNQTTKTVTRAGIGAAIGALIGAIAGGGQGAVIGAGVGAGAGVGSVILQGKDDVILDNGTEFMITASAPANVSNFR